MSASKIAKAIEFTAQANEKHTATKIGQVLKWLKSGHEVRVRIAGKPDHHKAMVSIFQQLETEAKSGAKLLQKVTKPESIKFIMKPTENAANLLVEAKKMKVDVDEEIKQLEADKDIFSDEFEDKLEQSIREERQKNRKR